MVHLSSKQNNVKDRRDRRGRESDTFYAKMSHLKNFYEQRWDGKLVNFIILIILSCHHRAGNLHNVLS